MRLLVVAALLVGLTASTQGLTFLEDGKEYVYATESALAAGTMDYASASSGFSYKMNVRIQVSGKTLNVQFENLRFSQFVGNHAANSWPYDATKFTAVQQTPPAFGVTFDDNGLFKQIVVPSGAGVVERNMLMGWAAQLQINAGEIRAGKVGFTSKEKMLQGNCEVTYAVSPGAVRKSVSHAENCEDRVYRLVDDYRRWQCDMGGPAKELKQPNSIANTVFLTEKKGSKFQVNAMISTSSLISQMFDEEGAAHFVFSNSTSILSEVKSSSGDISPSGDTITDLSYQFGDTQYAWNKPRDLKAKEQMLESGFIFEQNQNDIKQILKKSISAQKDILDSLKEDQPSLDNAHKRGVGNIVHFMKALDYNNLRGVADELMADKSDTGVMKANIFTELLGSVGTGPSAKLVIDMVMNNKFNNDRDAARALTGVPFHIMRPNQQLVEEFEKLLDFDGGRFVEMAAPLALGHLVRITCQRPGGRHDTNRQEMMACNQQLATKYVQKFFNKYKASASHEDKATALAVIYNIRWGNAYKLLRPVIYGEIEKDEGLRAWAMWAASWDGLFSGNAPEHFLPIFSDRSLNHELRLGALELIMWAKPKPAHLSIVLTVLFNEQDYEVVNYAYALFERHASNIDPCGSDTAKLAQYFLKYMRQFSGYQTDWGFGVSKTYIRQFYKKKYGYAGSMTYYCMGSHGSTTPLSIGFGIDSTMSNNYQTNVFGVHLRLQGVAKALVRKFKTMDAATWKTADLERILSGEMGVRERPNQPVRAAITVMIKATVVFQRSYDDSALEKDGKIGSFLEKFKGLGETYSVNHQRAINLGSIMYEQPTNLGIPAVIFSSITVMAHLTATVKRGSHRGLLYRDVNYDIHLFTQGGRGAAIPQAFRKTSYAIFNSRIYHAHFPRKFVIGVNPIKKELKFSVSRPKYDDPWRIMMHSRTQVMVRSYKGREGDYLPTLQKNCPACESTRVTVSRGADAVKSRVFVDRENPKTGSYLMGKYFDCEMDISRANTWGNMARAFMPYNKNPKTLYTSITMGIRQTRAFFFFFPKTEQCGVMLRWSQAKNNPVNEIEISVRGNVEANGERLFFRGRKWFIKAVIKAKGQPADRLYRLNMAYEFTPGNLKNKVKVQFNRAAVAALDMNPYTMCFALENTYPAFSQEFLDYDRGEMAVAGQAMVQYGKGTSCGNTEGEIRVKFRHSTTEEARAEMLKAWYWRACSAQKASPEWSQRKGFPFTEECYLALWDATAARRYTWKFEFVKLTNRMKSIVANIQTAIKAGLLPYWDMDPEGGSNGDIGPFLNMEATFKKRDKAVDIRLETTHGEEEFTDVPLTLNWTKKLRNLKFTPMIKRLMDTGIIKPCVTTGEKVRTMDNVTYAYEAPSCWTLVSATCGPKPTYAVFIKKGSGMPLAAKAFFGGHEVEFTPNGPGNIAVKVDGAPLNLADQTEEVHKEGGVEIFKIFRWGSTYNVYSFLKGWVVYDGTFVEVVPAPSTKGQHCGLCGNYNKNKFDEWVSKDLSTVHKTAKDLVEDWKWKC